MGAFSTGVPVDWGLSQRAIVACVFYTFYSLLERSAYLADKLLRISFVCGQQTAPDVGMSGCR